jgi:cold shock CspA family protein/ribosome-associated translation inhibitor RaiA
VQIDPEVAFRNVELTEPLKKQIRAGIRGLEDVFDRLTSCRIMVEQPDQRHRTGNLYHVRIDLTMAGNDVAVNRSPAEHRAHEELRQALGETFDRAKRALGELARKQRGDIKSHEAPAHGRVVRLFPDYGFVAASDGQEVYFNRNSVVLGNFERLEEGAEVRLVVELGEEGPQASTVHVVGKHHIVD